MKIYRDKNGKKLYPVCKWENNQHKLYNAWDKANIEMEDSDYSEKACDLVDEIERLIGVFNDVVVDGMVYANYEDGCKIKNLVYGYNLRTGWRD